MIGAKHTADPTPNDPWDTRNPLCVGHVLGAHTCSHLSSSRFPAPGLWRDTILTAPDSRLLSDGRPSVPLTRRAIPDREKCQERLLPGDVQNGVVRRAALA